MVTSVNKASIIPDVWKNFYDRIKDQVTTASITGPKTITIQNYVSTFPDKLIDSKAAYPILIVETPSLTGEKFTIGKDRLSGKISIEIYVNQAEAADKFLTQIIEAVETYKYSFREAGLTTVKLDSTDSDSAVRDKIKIHVRKAVFAFNFQYVKTGAY